MCLYKTSFCVDLYIVTATLQNFTEKKHATSKCIALSQITKEQLRAQPLPEADDLTNMFVFYCRVDQQASIATTKALNAQLQSFETWVQNNKASIKETLISGSELPKCENPWK